MSAFPPSIPQQLDLSPEAIEDFCRRWAISELALFGSVLRPDFSAGSDVDVLVTFAPEARWSLLDFVAMRDELSSSSMSRNQPASTSARASPNRREGSSVSSVEVWGAAIESSIGQLDCRTGEREVTTVGRTTPCVPGSAGV